MVDFFTFIKDIYATTHTKSNLKVTHHFTHIPHNIQQATLDPTKYSHYYNTPDGKRYPSVTTVLGKTKSQDAKNSLQRWRNDVGQHVAEYIMREAATIGTQVHEINEAYLDNKPQKTIPRLISHAHHENFKPYLNKIDDIFGNEIRLYSDTMKLAGTADCIAKYDGTLSVIDYKTKRSTQKEEWMTDYFIQVTAYAMMWEELTGQKITQGVILVSSEKNTMQEFIVQTPQYKDQLLARLQNF